jgi:hypothetical protein
MFRFATVARSHAVVRHRVRTSASCPRFLLGSALRFSSSVSVPSPPSSNHAHKPLPNAKGKIIYTETDEAPALATYSLYPLISKVSRMSQLSRVVNPWTIDTGRLLFLSYLQYSISFTVISSQHWLRSRLFLVTFPWLVVF